MPGEADHIKREKRKKMEDGGGWVSSFGRYISGSSCMWSPGLGTEDAETSQIVSWPFHS